MIQNHYRKDTEDEQIAMLRHDRSINSRLTVCGASRI